MAFEEVKQDDGSIRVMLDDKPLVCPVCGNDHFHERVSLMHRLRGGFLAQLFGDDRVTNFICTKCGYISSFLTSQVETHRQ